MDNQTPNPIQTNQDQKFDLYGHTRLGLLIIGVFILTIGGRYCGQRKIKDTKPGQSINIKDNGTKTITQDVTKRVNRYIPPEGSVTITPKDKSKSLDDIIKIHYQEYGWTFEPGIQFSGNIYYSYGLDAKLFYAWRFGLGTGIVRGSNIPTVLSPDIFVSYRLDQIHLRNTELAITYVPLGKIPFGLGLRINL